MFNNDNTILVVAILCNWCQAMYDWSCLLHQFLNVYQSSLQLLNNKTASPEDHFFVITYTEPSSTQIQISYFLFFRFTTKQFWQCEIKLLNNSVAINLSSDWRHITAFYHRFLQQSTMFSDIVPQEIYQIQVYLQ